MLDYLRSPICGNIINNYDFEILVSLVKHTLYCLAQEIFSIVGWNDDAYFF